MNENYFNKLNAINVSDKTEKKNNLTYLSWAWAWGEVKKIFPDANYKVYETETGCIYWNDGKTAWVKTGVTVNGIEHIEYLPVMDYKNKSIKIEEITSFDVNKTIQRSLTKAVARHGLGLYIYAGEDLPEKDDDEKELVEKKEAKKEPLITAEQIDELEKLGVNFIQLAKYYKVADYKDLTAEQGQKAIEQKKRINKEIML